jgi:hypothetical protein
MRDILAPSHQLLRSAHGPTNGRQTLEYTQTSRFTLRENIGVFWEIALASHLRKRARKAANLGKNVIRLRNQVVAPHPQATHPLELVGPTYKCWLSKCRSRETVQPGTCLPRSHGAPSIPKLPDYASAKACELHVSSSELVVSWLEILGY